MDLRAADTAAFDCPQTLPKTDDSIDAAVEQRSLGIAVSPRLGRDDGIEFRVAQRPIALLDFAFPSRHLVLFC